MLGSSELPLMHLSGKSAYRTVWMFIWLFIYCALALRKSLEND